MQVLQGDQHADRRLHQRDLGRDRASSRELSARLRKSAAGFRLPGAPVPRQVAAAGAAIAAPRRRRRDSQHRSAGATTRTRTVSLAS